MSYESKSLVSPLKKVKALGSSGHGTKIWWMQRLTAVALVPLSVWFVCLILRMFKNADPVNIIMSPLNIVLLILFTGTGLYHGMLGMREIIEDYVHNRLIKLVSLLILYFFTIFTALTGFCAILVFHLYLLKSN